MSHALSQGAVVTSDRCLSTDKTDSRSQQALYGKNLRSAPSFLETSSHSLSPSDAFPSRDEEAGGWEDEGVRRGEEEDQIEAESGVTDSSTHDTLGGRRRSSASPVIFTADPFVVSPPSLGPPDAAPHPVHPADRADTSTPTPGARGLLAQGLGAAPGYGAMGSKRVASTSSTSTAVGKTHPGQRALDGAAGIGPKDLGETTPLLSFKASQPVSPTSPREAKPTDEEDRDAARARRRSSVLRRLSVEARRRTTHGLRRLSEASRGDSTDGQTVSAPLSPSSTCVIARIAHAKLFNAVAVLLGIGVLSLPLAFAYAGWVAGTAMLMGFAWLTCHT